MVPIPIYVRETVVLPKATIQRYDRIESILLKARKVICVRGHKLVWRKVAFSHKSKCNRWQTSNAINVTMMSSKMTQKTSQTKLVHKK